MKRSRFQIGLSKLEIAGTLVIIAVVAAILFPVFQRVRENHHRSCPSHMKQLGLALIQYTNDADEKMPPGVDALNNGWAGQLYPYVKSTGNINALMTNTMTRTSFPTPRTSGWLDNQLQNVPAQLPPSNSTN